MGLRQQGTGRRCPPGGTCAPLCSGQPYVQLVAAGSVHGCQRESACVCEGSCQRGVQATHICMHD